LAKWRVFTKSEKVILEKMAVKVPFTTGENKCSFQKLSMVQYIVAQVPFHRSVHLHKWRPYEPKNPIFSAEKFTFSASTPSLGIRFRKSRPIISLNNTH
jgi:hypothetical protein